MRYTKPYFYDDFKCKADKCTDTCCAGWEVDIDSESYNKYKSISSDFGKRLMDGIILSDGQPCFRLCENDRCVFLAHDGLCDIYSNLGEEYLCEICREHPRFYDFFEGVTEIGLGLCCERVCELIFASDSPVTFETYEDLDDADTNEDDTLYFLIREKCFKIIQNRNEPLSTRIKNLICYSLSVQNELFSDSKSVNEQKCIKELFTEVVKLFSETEPINEEWTEYIKDIENCFDTIFVANGDININEYEYEQILTYMLYRHFMQSRFSGNILSVVAFCIISIMFIYLCDCKTFYEKRKIELSDRINTVKLWSKQIEYSDENTQLLFDKAGDVFAKNNVL